MKMKKLRLIQLASFSLCLALVISCGQQSPSIHKNKHAVLKFNRHKLMDKQGTGLVAATYLVPEGWKVQDEIDWDINNVAQPATFQLLIYDEETNSSMQGFPNMVFLVNTDEKMNDDYPEGSNYLGAIVINQKPEVLDLIKEYILPEFSNTEGFKIVESKNLSHAKNNNHRAGKFKNPGSKMGMIKIEYTENGEKFEEAIYSTLTFNRVSKYQEYAYLSLCYGCKAVKGDLENNMGIFETILNSVKLSPKWAVTYKQVIQIAMQNAARNARSRGGSNDSEGNYSNYENGGRSNYTDDTYGNRGSGGSANYDYNGYENNYGGMTSGNYSAGNAGNLSDYLHQANEYVNNSMVQSYEDAQRSEDRLSEARSDYMLDYQNYTNPNTGDVYKLSTGYDNAWADNSGNIIMSNEAGYDPNVGGGSSSWSSLDVGGSTVAATSATVTEPE
jgi:hypothetical protein